MNPSKLCSNCDYVWQGDPIDGREGEEEEEVKAPRWTRWWERRSGGKMRHQWRKRGRSGDAWSPHQPWLLSHRCHISYARKRADSIDDEQTQLRCTKNLMRLTPASNFGWRKRKNVLSLCLPCPDWAILSFGGIRCFWRGCGSFTPAFNSNISHSKVWLRW